MNVKEKIKKPLVAGAALAAITVTSLGAVGAVSAASDTSSTSDSGSSSGISSLVEKIASKFNLSEDEVQAVFDEDRSAHEAEMKADRAERIKQAVTDGKLTQDQADHITSALEEIDSLRGTGNPGDESDTTRGQVRTKMDALRTWAEEQNLDLRTVMGGMGRGHGGPGGIGGPRPDDAGDSSDDSTQSSSSDDSSDSATTSSI